MTNADLCNAYRWNKAEMVARWNPTRNGLRNVPTRFSAAALDRAHADVAKGVKRYLADKAYAAVSWATENRPRTLERIGFVQDVERAGLRHVGNVEADTPRGEIWSRRDACGWYTTPNGETFKDGTGLCWGVVYQLPARDGRARFVAGYVMGVWSDDRPTIDFGTIYEGERDANCSYEGSKGNQAARDAARAADSMAQRAAEEEREYQAAYGAGVRFAELGDEIAEARRQARELLADRRKARQRSPEAFPSICNAIRENVRRALADIGKAREERRKLQAGDYVREWLPGFWSGDARLQAAFKEGATGN